MSRATLFQEKHLIEFGLEVTERSPVTSKVLTVACQFCKIYGSEDREVDEGIPVKTRRVTTNIMTWGSPFRAERYRSHMKNCHSTKWSEFVALSPAEKVGFFSGYSIEPVSATLTCSGFVRKIVLTGGPCGGKSSSLAYLTSSLKDRGYRVLTVPEASTLLQVTCGGVYPGRAPEKHLELLGYENALFQLEVGLEDAIFALAEVYRSLGQGVVVLLDRGLMDIKAYCPPDLWTTLLRTRGVTLEQDLRTRYDLVVHLVTTAQGAEHCYTTANNAARTETAEQARALDESTFRCWADQNDHRHLVKVVKVINRSVDHAFDVKLQETLTAVLDVLPH